MKVQKITNQEYKFFSASTTERQCIIHLNSFQDFKITHISKIEGYDSWDVVYVSGGTNNLAEIKVRNKFIDGYPDYIIEEKKYNELIRLTSTEKGKNNNLQPVYINFFFDGCVIWNLNEVELEFRMMDMPDNSQTTNYTKSKSCALLRPKDGHIIRYNTDITKRQEEAITIMKFLFPNN
jgi:hypothetical protein